jgi:thioredoxin-dependent peroxiredoxin
LDAEVVGVSLDTPEKHAAFAEAYTLPYPLVSDGNAKIAQAYGVSRLGGWLPTKRVTFVIDKDGVVRQVIHSEFSIDRHIEEAIATLQKLQKA